MLPEYQPPTTRRAALRLPGWLFGTLALLALAGLLASWPGGLLDKADHAAYAVCHRFADRTFWIAGRPLPLCARCSGTYLGTLTSLLVLALLGRARADTLPPRRYMALSALFMVLWGVDGLNSFLTLFPGAPHLYTPHNLLRLVTGALEGIVLSIFLLPVVNTSFWRDAPGDSRPVVAGRRDMGWLLAGAAALVLIVASEQPALLYPLALLSGLTVLGLIGLINTLLLLGLLRRSGQAHGWRDLWVPLAGGLALAAAELSAIALLRTALSAYIGLPL